MRIPDLRGKKILRLIFLIIVPLLTGYLLYRVRRILVPFAFALVIAYLLNPLVNTLEKRKVPRSIAILIVYLTVFGGVGSIAVFGIPAIMGELVSLGQAIPRFISEMQSFINEAEARYSRFALPDPVRRVFDENIELVERSLIGLVGGLAQGMVDVFRHSFSFLIAPVFAFYLLKDSGSIKKALLSIMPTGWRSDVMSLSSEVNRIFSNYIRGHLTVCGIVGILTGLGYALIGLEYAIMLGIFAGIADLIPYFGPVVGALPALMLAMLDSKTMVLKVVIVVLVIQQLENSIISPKILGDSLGLSPLVIILALMAGGELYGLVGLLLAVPVTAILKCFIHFLYLKLID